MEAVKQLEGKLMQAVERQDFVAAEELKEQLIQLKGENKSK